MTSEVDSGDRHQQSTARRSYPVVSEGGCHGIHPRPSSPSELPANSGVCHEAVQFRPCVGRPPAAGTARWQQQRVKASLPNVGNVLQVKEHTRRTGRSVERAFTEHSDYQVAATLTAEWIVFQCLPAGIVQLQSNSKAAVLLDTRNHSS